jgi:arabinan endo-1,5-alpha-L-arabinosidase
MPTTIPDEPGPRHPTIGTQRARRSALLVGLLALPALAQGPRTDPEFAHDPSAVVVAEDGTPRVLATGGGLAVLRRDADGRWRREGRVFPPGGRPAWHARAVPGNRGDLWAPDVLAIDGSYYVYYSVSTFGRNESAIGLAVGPTLDPASPRWRWEDRGPVVVSRRADRYNAIDPAAFRDPGDGRLWLAFGSFWDGVFLVELDPETGLRRDPDAPPTRLAHAPEIEAPCLVKRESYYYLFVNWGRCCRGAESTYEIRVGRAREVTGPYVDRDGKALRDGGGTLVLGSSGRFVGPGHASIRRRGDDDWLVHHYYDAAQGGRARLRMLPLSWDARGWPSARPEATPPDPF